MKTHSSAGNWTRQVIAILENLQATQRDVIATASEWCAEAIGAGGFVNMFGSGHSRMAVEEMFPRYGSFPGFNPMVELSTTFHTQVVGSNGQRQAMFIERVSGLAEVMMANFAFRPTDVMLIFSVSGTSAVPIELTEIAKKRGLRTIAVTSVQHSQSSESSSGTRLMDIADLVVDIGTPPGDALVTIPGLETPVGPSSTVATVAVVNEIKVQTAEILVSRGIFPPVLTGPMIIGKERSAQIFDAAYDDHARRIGFALGEAGRLREGINGQRPVF